MQSKRWENLWYYHKWQLLPGIGALFLLLIIVSDFKTMRDKPDYQIGMLMRETMPSALAEELETGLASVFDDRDGDGKHEVEITMYVLDYGSSEGKNFDAIMNQSSSVVQFMGDYQTQQCMLYLCRDVTYFQELFGVFAYNDGSVFENGELNYDELGLAWSDSAALSSIALTPFNWDGETVDANLFMKDFKLLLRCPSEQDDFSEQDVRYYQDAYRAFHELF